MSGSSEENIILSFQNSLLRASDINLLRGPHWLNDQIISFYLEYLEHSQYKNNADILFVSPEVVQCIKLVSKQEISIFLEPLNAANKQFIFFPLNDNAKDRAGGCHWSLLVFSRAEQTFFHFDSFNRNNLAHCYQFVRNLAHGIGCKEFDIKSCECLQQTNGYDCGIHVICNIECVAKHIVENGRIGRRRNISGDNNDDDGDVSDDRSVGNVLKLKEAFVRNKRKELLHLIEELKRK